MRAARRASRRRQRDSEGCCVVAPGELDWGVPLRDDAAACAGWRALAAWLARMGQALFDFRELQLQLYVAAPWWAVRGTIASR